MNTSTQATTSNNNSNTKGNTIMNNSTVTFNITSGSTCCSVGGFTDSIVTIPVNEILITPVCRAVDLFNSYAKDFADIKVHFEDTLVFCQDTYYEANKDKQQLIESGLEFCNLVSKAYPAIDKNGPKDFLHVNSFSTSNTPKGTNMNNSTITFEQAVYNRLNTCKTWNPTRLNTVVREMWVKENSLLKSESTGDFMKKFFENFRGDLQARKFSFFDTSIVISIYNRTWEAHTSPKEDYIKDVIEATPSHQVYVYTDGSCNVGAKTGGWGVHMTVKGYPKFDKDFSGNQENTTNNAMELVAMIEAIKAIDFKKKGFDFNLVTDSKYVLQSICNQGKYGREGYKKSANVELLKLLYTTMSEKRIKFDEFTRPVMGNKIINSGDVVHRARTPNGNKVNFLWIKGHSDNGGNDKADKLATQARKQLDKAAKDTVDVVVPEVTLEAPTVSLIDSTADQEMVTKDMIDNAKTFEDIKAIIEVSKTLELGGTCGEDFTYYTAVLLEGKSVFEIVTPERASSREGYIQSAANQLVTYLKAEGIYSDSDSSVDSVKVTDQDLEVVAEYNKLNSTHDFTYMMSDDSRSYAAGLKSEETLTAIEETLSPLQLDLIALYHNHLLNRAGQFGKTTSILEDSMKEAVKYYSV